MKGAPDAITQLRAVVPRRGLSPAEARRIAELQAAKLLELSALDHPAVPEEVVTTLPEIQVSRRNGWPTSGLATAVGNGWAIIVRADEAAVRQRFSVIHEFKHVLDDPFIEWLYPTRGGYSPEERAEAICDYFAACVLMPRAWIKRDFGDGIQSVEALARRYEVSRIAMRYRLEQLGLSMPAPRCAGSTRLGVAA